MRPSKNRTVFAVALCVCGSAVQGAVIHVNAAAAPGGNGSSWSSARNNLRLALDAAQSGDQVWIARGTYKPDTVLDRGVRFRIRNGVQVYGGFVGNETSIDQRPADPDPGVSDPAFDTVLSGEIGAPGMDDNTVTLVDMEFASSSTRLDRVVVRDGSSASRGGGMRCFSTAAIISEVLFTNNRADGGAIWIEFGNDTLVENCRFVANTAGSEGGAMLVRQGSAIIRGCTFENNTASIRGAGIALAFSGSVVVENSVFRGNNGPFGGGGAIGAVLSSSVTVRDSQFINNTLPYVQVASGGGAINMNTGTMLVERSTFDGSVAGQGGAFDNQGSSATFRDCTFRNGLSNFGGAINNPIGTLELERCIFESNVGGAGGAIHTRSSLTATGCIFRSNSTFAPVNNGGAVYLGGPADFTDCLFELNQSNAGGAIYAIGGPGTYERCSFVGNFAHASGGTFWHQSGSHTYTNSVISGSTSLLSFGFGGVLFHANGSGSFINCTIANNSGGQEAIRHGSGTLSIVNSIVRNAGVELVGAIDVSYSNVEGGAPGVGNIDAAPTYVDAASADYRLAPGSAGIDAGQNAALPLTSTLDLAGLNRFVDDLATLDSGVGAGPIVDMGAYELQSAPVPCPGDADGNGGVNFNDITTVLANFGSSVPGFGPGDADGNGSVNFNDITTVLANFGSSCA